MPRAAGRRIVLIIAQSIRRPVQNRKLRTGSDRRSLPRNSRGKRRNPAPRIPVPGHTPIEAAGHSDHGSTSVRPSFSFSYGDSSEDGSASGNGNQNLTKNPSRSSQRGEM